MIELVDPRPPVPAGELDAAERLLAELGHAIPPSYHKFLTEQDGGVPVKDRLSFKHEDRMLNEVVAEFLGVALPSVPSATNLVRTVSILGERIPRGVLPIADDPFGNLICLDGRDGRDGPVLFWDHEYEGEPPDDANLYVVAPDLQTFLDGLREREPRPPASKLKGLKRLFGRGWPDPASDHGDNRGPVRSGGSLRP